MKLNKSKTPMWNGYTLEELRGQRTLTAAQIMIEQHRLKHRIDLLKQSFSEQGRSRKTIAGRIMASLTIMDWAVLAFSVGRRVLPLLRRKKRN